MKVFLRISGWGSSLVSLAEGGGSVWVSSPKEEQHMNSVQAFLQASRQGREASPMWATVASHEEEPEQEINSGWTVQQFTPTLRSTFVTPDIRSAHLWTNIDRLVCGIKLNVGDVDTSLIGILKWVDMHHLESTIQYVRCSPSILQARLQQQNQSRHFPNVFFIFRIK